MVGNTNRLGYHRCHVRRIGRHRFRIRNANRHRFHVRNADIDLMTETKQIWGATLEK